MIGHIFEVQNVLPIIILIVSVHYLTDTYTNNNFQLNINLNNKKIITLITEIDPESNKAKTPKINSLGISNRQKLVVSKIRKQHISNLCSSLRHRLSCFKTENVHS